jgi:hypothetical protein
MDGEDRLQFLLYLIGLRGNIFIRSGTSLTDVFHWDDNTESVLLMTPGSDWYHQITNDDDWLMEILRS